MQILLHKRTFYSIVFIAVNFLLFGTAFGQTTKTWDGGANTNNWNDANNWNPDGVPTEIDNVIIGNFNVTINSAAQCASLTLGGGINSTTLTISESNSLNVTGTLTIDAPTDQNRTITVAVGNGTLSCGSIIMTEGNNGSRICQLTIATGLVTVSGDISMNRRNLLTFSGSGTLNIGGSITDGILNTGTATNCTVNYNGAAQTVYPTTYQNLTLSGSGNKTMSGVNAINGSFTLQSTVSATAAGSLNISRDVIIGAGASFNAGNFNHTVGGNWTNNGTFNSSSSTVTFNGTSTQIINGSQPSQFNIVLVNNTGVILDQNISTKSSLTVNGTMNTNSKQITGTGNFSLSTSGTLITSSTNGVDGSIAVSGTKNFPLNGGSYVFNGATTTPFSSVMSSAINISNLTIGNNVALNKNVSIAGTLTLNSGLLRIPSNNTLVLASPNSLVGSGFSSSKHIVTEVNASSGEMGIFQVNGVANSFELPVGNGSLYLPATVTPASQSDFKITVFTGITADGKPGPALTDAQRTKMLNVVWDITGTNGVATTISLGWPKNQGLEGESFLNAPGSSIGISHYTNGQWDPATGTYDPNTNTVSRSGITSFSSFAAMLMSEDLLPVHFSNIRATEKASGVQVDFTNLTESDVDYYEVERSLDGKAFRAIKKLLPQKNNYGSVAYSWLDVTAQEGRNLYRVKAVETTGKTVYSSLVSITLGAKNTALSVYAKGGQVALQVSSLPAGKYQLQLFNAAGQMLGIETLNHGGGSISQTTSLNSAKPGIYILNINGAVRMQQKFLVQ